MGGHGVTHLFGGSADAKACSRAIGATVSHCIGRKLFFAIPATPSCSLAWRRDSPGFRNAAAATVFALEVSVGRLGVSRAISRTGSRHLSRGNLALGLE